MKGGRPNDQWMKNALASGSIVAPRESVTERHRRLHQPLGMAWTVMVALGLVALVVAAIVE